MKVLSKFREQAAFSFNKEEVDLTIGVMDPQGQGQGQGQYHLIDH